MGKGLNVLMRFANGIRKLPGRLSGRTQVLLILALTLILRLAAVSWVGWNRVAFGDARDYLSAAGQLCETGTYQTQGDLPFFRAPGLPFAIAAGTLCHPRQVWLVKVWLVLFDAATVLVVLALGRVLLRSEPLARLSALAAAVNPVFLDQATGVRTEPLFMLLLSAALLCFFTAWTRQGKKPVRLLVAAGGLLGLAALTRPSALIGIPFFAAAWLARGRPTRRRATGALALIAAATAALSPWVVRNALAYRELIVVNDAGGYAVWRGMHPEMQAILNSGNRAEYQARIEHFHNYTQAEAAAKVAARAATPATRSREWLALALGRARAHPAAAAAILGGNLGRYWRPWLNPLEHSRRAVGLSAAVLVPFLALGGAGLVLLLRRDRGTGLIVLSWIVVTWLARAPFQVVMRFRIPYTDPILLVLGVAALAELGRATGVYPHIRHRSSARKPALGSRRK